VQEHGFTSGGSSRRDAEGVHIPQPHNVHEWGIRAVDKVLCTKDEGGFELSYSMVPGSEPQNNIGCHSGVESEMG